jgi:hypothetical protein
MITAASISVGVVGGEEAHRLIPWPRRSRERGAVSGLKTKYSSRPKSS